MISNIKSINVYINKYIILSNIKKNEKEIRFLCFLSACISSKKLKYLKYILENAKKYKIQANKIYETIIQIYLFCGFPATIEALKIFNHIFPEVKNKSEEFDLTRYLMKGKKNCMKIYGSNYDKLINNFNNLSPDLKNWMIIEGYGKVMGRQGLNIKERELINVSILSTNYYEHQLYSHIKGAFNTGAGYKSMEAILNLTSLFNSKNNIKRSIRLLKTIKTIT